MSQITDQIKDRIDLVDLIREYVPELKKAGVSWKARCPFHQEKTPSFIVSPDKGIWHCFGCHAGGDVFAFVQKIEGLEFPDALRLLAERAGVKLERRNREAESERGRLLEILRLASRWYHQALLQSKSGETARAYVKSRELSDKTVVDWQLGFAPDAWDELLKYLQSRGYREQEIAKTGLAASNNRGGYYDRFRYRLLFPIQDVHGNVVGFTARKLREEDLGGKYINTPETALYHKSQVLYGLAKAKSSIRAAGLAVVVEGNMDCLASHQAGVENVIAASGTALTSEQIKLLKRFTSTVCLAFDPDAAGQTALRRGLETAWQEDMTIQVAPLPRGLDPDGLIKKDPAAWRALIESRQNFMDWLFARAGEEHDLSAAAGKKQAARELLPWISRLADAVEQTHYLQLLARNINVPEAVLRNVLERKERPPAAGKPVAPAKRDVWEQAARRLLALILPRPDKHSFLENFSLDWLPNETWTSLYKSLDFFYDSRIAEAREVRLLADELSANLTEEEIALEIERLRRRLKENFLQKKLLAIREQIREAEASGRASDLEQHLGEWKHLSEELRRS